MRILWDMYNHLGSHQPFTVLSTTSHPHTSPHNPPRSDEVVRAYPTRRHRSISRNVQYPLTQSIHTSLSL
ncbi:hypothetical protein E2C01_038080 [Portunus trituberculatus]|uniref:Uncharacterized protein n=1 Tax=Portunus trituberculatus TaxID=210409 RepID=A0A5B7FFV0_PORTR|nr:hypothetical protein [Portunus trituberculatus]